MTTSAFEFTPCDIQAAERFESEIKFSLVLKQKMPGQILNQQELQSTVSHTQVLREALEHAEKLADQFAYIKPEPYAVPMERFVGVPYEHKK
jgi:hypothetical protein